MSQYIYRSRLNSLTKSLRILGGLTSLGVLLSNAVCADDKGLDYKVYGAGLLRFESDYDAAGRNDVERMRFVGLLGVKADFGDSGFFGNARLSTGFKSNQGIPAIIIHRFNDQKLGEQDVYFDQMYLGYKNKQFSVKAGKVDWPLPMTVDMFWDMNINPYGISFEANVSEQGILNVAALRPLDGTDNTIGTLNLLSYRHSWKMGDVTYMLNPWYVDYQGENGAIYATKDTQYDNSSLRLTTWAKFDQWKLAFEYGRSLDDFAVSDAFKNEKNAWATSVIYGNLKKIGSYEASYSWLHVERFGAITQFAQNTMMGFSTTNFEGPDARFRYKVGKNWWVGFKYSGVSELAGPTRNGKRLRVETRVSF